MGGFGIAILFSLFSFVYLFFVAIAISVILYLLYSYIFQSIASMCMLKNIGYAYPFTAWIPFYHKYLLGKIANKQILGAISGVLSFISIWSVVVCWSFWYIDIFGNININAKRKTKRTVIFLYNFIFFINIQKAARKVIPITCLVRDMMT